MNKELTQNDSVVRWYYPGNGLRIYFPNGYGISITPAPDHQAKVATMAYDLSNTDGEVTYLSPSELVDYINELRDLVPPGTIKTTER